MIEQTINRPTHIIIDGIKPPIFYISDNSFTGFGEKVSGIYALICLQEGSMYVGSASDIDSRIRSHVNQLASRTHRNYKIQDLYNRFPDQWAFVCMEPVAGLDRNAIYRKESGYLKSPLYNLNIERSPWAGLKRMNGKKHSR